MVVNNFEIAVVGGGCFWCTEAIFKSLKGVRQVTSGYAGGQTPDPYYIQVAGGQTGHAEVIKIEFDPKMISFSDLLEIFFELHDPTTLNRQGHDTGEEYRSIILYLTPEQKAQAENYIKQLSVAKKYSHPIVTEVKPLDHFYPAESFHQDFYAHNSSQLYCRLIISPKLKKLREKFGSKIK